MAMAMFTSSDMMELMSGRSPGRSLKGENVTILCGENPFEKVVSHERKSGCKIFDACLEFFCLQEMNLTLKSYLVKDVLLRICKLCNFQRESNKSVHSTENIGRPLEPIPLPTSPPHAVLSTLLLS